MKIKGFPRTKRLWSLASSTGAPDRYRERSYSPHLVCRTLTCPPCPFKTIRFNLRSLPEDGADKYFLKDLGNDIQVSLSVTFRGGFMPGSKLRKAIEDPNKIFTSNDMKGLFGDSNKSIVTTSKINGVNKERTVYLDDDNAKLIRPYYVLDVTENSRGYSEYASIRDAVMKFIKDNEDLSKLV